jgi:hypothetical protein
LIDLSNNAPQDLLHGQRDSKTQPDGGGNGEKAEGVSGEEDA